MSAKPRVLVFRAAGINCEREMIHAFEFAGAQVDLVHLHAVVARKASLADYQILGFPGGFSYGDDIAAGRIFANELRCHLSDALRAFEKAGGLAIGVCNGFQILAKAGILPGNAFMGEPEATLADNDSGRFECRWIYVRGSSPKCVWFPQDDVIELPVAHGEGKFITRDPAMIETLAKNSQIAFTYVDKNGKPAGYPANPNGSMANIAGVCNPSGRILGLMPHPERFIHGYAHPSWTRSQRGAMPGDGLRLFQNAVNFAQRELL